MHAQHAITATDNPIFFIVIPPFLIARILVVS
jgi:hypothetical protein